MALHGAVSAGQAYYREVALVIVAAVVAAVIIVAAGGAGARLLRIFGVPVRRGERTFAAVAVGLGAMSLILFAAGLLGLFYAAFAWAFLGLCLGFFARDAAGVVLGLWRIAMRFVAARGAMQWVLAVVIAVTLAFDLVSTFAPPTETDALTLHVLVPREYASTHKMAYRPDNWDSAMAMGPHLVYTVAILASGGDKAPAVLHFLTGVIFLMWVWEFARKRVGREAAYIAAAVLVTMPMMTHLIMAPMVDMFFTLYAFGALVFLIDVMRTGARSSIMAAAALTAFSAGTKYTGLVVMTSVMVTALVWAAFRAEKRGRGVAAVIAAGVAALAIASPFLIRNYAWTGNPVFPTMKSVFSTAGWDAPAWSDPGLGDPRHEVLGKSAVNMLLAPWRVTTDAEMTSGGIGEAVGPALLVFLPVAFLLRSRKRLFLQLALYSATAFVLIYWTSPRPRSRYLLSIMPVLAIYAGAGTALLSKAGRAALAVGRCVILVAVLSGLVVSAVYSLPFAKAAAGVTGRDEFLSRSADFYAEYMWMDENLPDDAVVLVQATNDLYYCPRRALGLGLDSRYTHTDSRDFFALDDMGTADAALGRLRELGVTHVFAASWVVGERSTNSAGLILAEMEKSGLLKTVRETTGLRGTRNPFATQREEEVVLYRVVYEAGDES